MTDTAQQTRAETSGTESTADSARRNTGVYALDGVRGKTSVADGVVEKIAGMAARNVDGVHAMGGGMARAFHAARERVPGTTRSVSQGVRVEVGEKQTAIDLEIVIDYGVSITDVAGSVRESVISAVEWMTGLEVVEVNIFVSDVSLPGEEEEQSEQEQPRLR